MPITPQRLLTLYLEQNEFAKIEAKRSLKDLIDMCLSNFLNSQEDLEVCENEVFKALWETIPKEKPSSLIAYTSRIAKKIAIEKNSQKSTNKKSNEQTALKNLDSIFKGVSMEEIDEKILGEAIIDFLDNSSQQENDLFICKYWYGISDDVLAEKLGCSPSEINKKLSDINKRLKKYLKAEDVI